RAPASGRRLRPRARGARVRGRHRWPQHHALPYHPAQQRGAGHHQLRRPRPPPRSHQLPVEVPGRGGHAARGQRRRHLPLTPDAPAFHAGFVSVVGRPNVGKSTLVNRLVGQKIAIVSDKPQTTRNRILAVMNPPGGQIVLFDTPGIHKPMHRMNKRMVDTAVKSLGQVELAVWVIDITEPYGPGDRYVREVLKKSGRPVILAINKIDRVPKPKILSVIDQYRSLLDYAEVVPISA